MRARSQPGSKRTKEPTTWNASPKLDSDAPAHEKAESVRLFSARPRNAEQRTMMLHRSQKALVQCGAASSCAARQRTRREARSSPGHAEYGSDPRLARSRDIRARAACGGTSARIWQRARIAGFRRPSGGLGLGSDIRRSASAHAGGEGGGGGRLPKPEEDCWQSEASEKLAKGKRYARTVRSVMSRSAAECCAEDTS